MAERRSNRSGFPRRLWIPLAAVGLLAIPALRACGEAPSAVAEPPIPPTASSAVPTGAAEPVKTTLPARSVSRTGELCQEWKLGSPPRRVACPAVLADGELLVFERDATCTRKGGTREQASVACPMASELDAPLPPLASASARSVPDGALAPPPARP